MHNGTLNNQPGEEEGAKFIHYRLSNDYIRGLTDGEGCFTFCTVPKKVSGEIIKEKIPTFVIAMHVRDRWLLIEITEHLKINGNVYTLKAWRKDGANRGDTARFMVRSVAELRDIIIPFFYKKLAGFKGDQFIQWMENIGNDPMVGKRYKHIYEMYKSGYWDEPKNIPKWLQ